MKRLSLSRSPQPFASRRCSGPESGGAGRGAAKKADRRTLFAKTVSLAVPGVVLVALLAGTGVEFSSLSSKVTAASTAAKSAHMAGGLVAQVRAVDSAGADSILVDAGCIAVESQATADLSKKVSADDDAVVRAEDGTSYSAFVSAVGKEIDDEQSIVTDLQQDAALSSRATVKSAIGAFTGDLHTVISAEQQLLNIDLTDKQFNGIIDNLNNALDRIDGDGTAVDAMCGGDILENKVASSPASSTANT